MSVDTSDVLAKLDAAVTDGKITDGARENIHTWLTEARYESYKPAVIEHIENAQWQALDDVFWTIIPFLSLIHI